MQPIRLCPGAKHLTSSAVRVFCQPPRCVYARFIAGWQHYGSGDAMGIPGFAGQKLLLATRYAVPDRGREGMTQGTEVGLRVLKSTALPWQNAVVFVGVE